MTRSEPVVRRSSRLMDVLFLVAVPVLAVSALLWLSRPPVIHNAQVIEPSVSQTDDGFVGNVTWIDEGGRRVSRVAMTAEHLESGMVPMVVVEGEVRVVDPSEKRGVSTMALVTTAAIALAFAVVVLATVRGFGYVRGTGSAGEMTPDEVQESHGFYWRH